MALFRGVGGGWGGGGGGSNCQSKCWCGNVGWTNNSSLRLEDDGQLMPVSGSTRCIFTMNGEQPVVFCLQQKLAGVIMLYCASTPEELVFLFTPCLLVEMT